MSRKHFESLAAALRNRKPEAHWDPNKRVQWVHDCEAIADACQASNPRFDRGRFLAACGVA